MKELNLVANTPPQERIKEYLEQNASDVLADKINNGVQIEKNGKTLLSKKDLDGFMRYASDEARKMVEKGVNCAYVEDSVVFGWAIHYFEEDNIEGTLYNEDGTKYEAPKSAPKKKVEKPKAEKPKAAPVVTTKETPPTPPPTKKTPSKNSNQMSLFDFLGEENEDSED